MNRRLPAVVLAIGLLGCGADGGGSGGSSSAPPVNPPPPPPPPGPTAFEGFGATSVGGAGGSVYHVTSLANSGTGTLRDGIVNRTGPRTIVFDVGGTIVLTADLVINKPYLTVDGSTAPSPGITIEKTDIYTGEVVIGGTHDIVLTHLRFQDKWVNGASQGNNNTGTLGIDGDAGPDWVAHHIVLDHITSRNGADGAIGIWGEVHDVTVSWCLVLFSGKTSVISHYPGPFQVRKDISWHHNVYAKNEERQPQIRADVRTLDFVNNVVYGWSYTVANYGYGTRIRNDAGWPQPSVNVVNNAYYPTHRPDWALVYGANPGPDAEESRPAGPAPAQGTVVTGSNMGSLWVSGNLLPPQNLDQYSTISAPLTVPPAAQVTTWPASELWTRVLPSAGMKYRDATEQAVLDEIRVASGH